MHLRSLLPTLIVAASFACKSSSEPSTPITEEGSLVPPPSEMEMGNGNDTFALGNLTLTATPVEAAAPIQSGGTLSQDASQVQLLSQRRAYLTGEHIRLGDEALSRADLSGAQLEYATALDTDPTSVDARRKLRNAGVHAWAIGCAELRPGGTHQ